MDGGSLWLLGVVRDHRGAVEYDLRSRFGLGLRDVGRTVTILEAGRLLLETVADPASHLGAALRGWDHPVSREAIILMHMYDQAQSLARVKRVQKYPRPWAGADTRRVAKNELTREETFAALRYAGHTNLPGEPKPVVAVAE